MHYFLRVNGDTLHNNPNRSNYYVPGELPHYPATYFNYLGFCFERNIARIGWPDTGDLNALSKTGALAQGYSLDSLQPFHGWCRATAQRPVLPVLCAP